MTMEKDKEVNEGVQFLGIDKRLLFITADETITNIIVFCSENLGLTSYQIKFSIKYAGTEFDRWYLITSINPLKVFGGLAGTFVQGYESIICHEYEVINFIVSKTPKDFYDMAKSSVWVSKSSDFHS